MSSACQSICTFESNFSALPLSLFKLKNRHWWNSGAKYHRINYLVKVKLGPADISFELWHDGVKLSEENSIKVEWQSSPPPNTNEKLAVADFPMSMLSLAAASTQAVSEIGK